MLTNKAINPCVQNMVESNFIDSVSSIITWELWLSSSWVPGVELIPLLS